MAQRLEFAMTIVVTNRIFPQTHAVLAEHGNVVVNTGAEPWPRDVILRTCRDADGLMVFMPDQIDGAFLEACPKLRVIGAALKGYDNIDARAAEAAGVWVTIVPDLLTVPTAELAIGLMLSLGRHMLAGDRNIRARGFSGWRPQLYGVGLAGTHAGIVGFGRVGQAVADRLLAFGCHIRTFDTDSAPLPRRFEGCVVPASLADLLSSSDWIVLALPLTTATRHIINGQSLALMKPTALLVNPARGSLVDESAVADAIASGRLAGYAADVFECEDWARNDRPSIIDPRLIAPDAPTVLTPHIGSAVIAARQKIELSAAHSIIEALTGREPTGAVNRPVAVRRV
jgi:phosphonate dehydrogenase